MRPVALGRRNWIHVGSEEAGPRVAAIISIVETTLQLLPIGVNLGCEAAYAYEIAPVLESPLPLLPNTHFHHLLFADLPAH